MKMNKTLSLLTLGAVLATEAVWAQSTPTGTATSTTYPQGAIATDSTQGKMSKSQKRAMKRNRKEMEQNSRGNSASTTNPQDGQYRQSSSSEGTAVNNSNTTNYNSNNVTNAPTGAGSNPSTMNTPTPADQVSNGQNNSAARSSASSDGAGYSPANVSTTTGATTGAAVSGASTGKEPAVKAGSTDRSASVGDFISSSPNFTTLQNALQSSDLFETLKGSGPYTVFAPSNKAFKKLPVSAQSGLLEGKNRDGLKKLLSYHVVRGEVDAAELGRRIKAGNGKAELQTLAGSTLLAKQGSNGSIELTDDQGHSAVIDAADTYKSANGVVHSIDVVLTPKGGDSLLR
ncbi:fasciclin domain-containing protein [Spirosoma oryzicola]|uniref:fasciclin domain-containing protein n=1 Tax=Spirosoma oryzicola TaxID=2898794 RepID=UPI001E5C624E|nr:fasciclin domain-containing protein [Spirosoma oryzicola]